MRGRPGRGRAGADRDAPRSWPDNEAVMALNGQVRDSGQESMVVILENKTRLLLILSQDVLDQARVIAGKATTVLKLPVSLQIVLRALIWVGLKRESHPALFAKIESQARAIRLKRSGEGRRG
jgi:hypothetical protein